MRLLVFIEDPRLFRSVISLLKSRGINFTVPLDPRLPEELEDVVLLTDSKRSYPNTVVISRRNWRRRVEEAICMVQGKTAYYELLIGIDPGEPPVYAAMADGVLIEHGTLDAGDPGKQIGEILSRIPHFRASIKIGNAGPHVDKIIESIMGKPRISAVIELVDESRTSRGNPKVRVRSRDAVSAVNIALRRGIRLEGGGS